MIASIATYVRGGVLKGRRPFFAIALCLTLAIGCRSGAVLPDSVLARVNDQSLTVATFQARLAAAETLGTVELPAEPEALVAVHQAFAQQLIDELLLEQEAARRGIDVDRQTVEAEIRAMYEGWPLKVFKKTAGDPAELYRQVRVSLLARAVAAASTAADPAPTDAEIRAHFDAHPAETKIAEHVHLRQIVCADRSRATVALTDVLTGGDFATVAKRDSIAPEAARGGDLGFIVRGELLPEIEENAFTLPVGEISTLIETPFGVHILQVLERLPSATLTFQQARPTIERLLKRRRAASRWRDFRQALRDRADITIDWRRLPG